MKFEEKYEIKQYKKFKQYSFNSRYDNGTISYFKYYKLNNLCKINYLPDNQIKKFTKELKKNKKNKLDKIIKKQINQLIIDNHELYFLTNL